jgi:NifU-like protein involved in Fe-S cluster formation
MFDDLYHGRVLELAADIDHVGRLAGAMGTSHKVSKICGSEITVDLDVADGMVTRFAIDPKACALGQASASILAASIVGAPVAEVIAGRDALRAMLKDKAPPPAGRFWELRHLEGVRDYTARHASTLLAFEAAVEAIENALAKENAG